MNPRVERHIRRIFTSAKGATEGLQPWDPETFYPRGLSDLLSDLLDAAPPEETEASRRLMAWAATILPICLRTFIKNNEEMAQGKSPAVQRLARNMEPSGDTDVLYASDRYVWISIDCVSKVPGVSTMSLLVSEDAAILAVIHLSDDDSPQSGYCLSVHFNPVDPALKNQFLTQAELLLPAQQISLLSADVRLYQAFIIGDEECTCPLCQARALLQPLSDKRATSHENAERPMTTQVLSRPAHGVN